VLLFNSLPAGNGACELREKRRDPDGVRDPGEWRGEIDATTYAKLSAIAPTITRPEDTAAAVWTWPNQLLWIGNITTAARAKRET
jgi:hypothetical protein